jgi:hypothetical protein
MNPSVLFHVVQFTHDQRFISSAVSGIGISGEFDTLQQQLMSHEGTGIRMIRG